MKRAERSKSIAIVADGRERALAAAAGELAARRARVEAAIKEKYAPRWQEAGAIHRCWLWLRMSWEIRREQRPATEKVAPRGALYAALPAGRKAGERSSDDAKDSR